MQCLYKILLNLVFYSGKTIDIKFKRLFQKVSYLAKCLIYMKKKLFILIFFLIKEHSTNFTYIQFF